MSDETVSAGVSVDEELSRRLAESLRDYARLLGDYQEIAARLVLAIEAGASIADGEATRLMVADHAAGRGIDGCCVQTARRIASAIRATDKADARARRVAAQRTAEGERDEARAEVQRLRAPRPSAIVLRPVEDVPVDAPVPFDDEDLALADGDRRALDVVTRERDEAVAKVAATEAIIEGRTTAPTFEEDNTARRAGLYPVKLAGRWHFYDDDGRLCAWPEVQP